MGKREVSSHNLRTPGGLSLHPHAAAGRAVPADTCFRRTAHDFKGHRLEPLKSSQEVKTGGFLPEVGRRGLHARAADGWCTTSGVIGSNGESLRAAVLEAVAIAPFWGTEGRAADF